jgi:hypothetical protein
MVSLIFFTLHHLSLRFIGSIERVSLIWKLKLEQLRLKIKGWSANIKSVLQDKKSRLTSSITKFEMLLVHRDLSNDEYDVFFCAKNELSNVYRDEVVYWQQRARL